MIQVPQMKQITLEQMDSIALMNRMDTKYWFHISKLQAILEQVKDEYYIFENCGMQELPYSTVYYDTPNNDMYIAHHNGVSNRYKVRRRTYMQSDITFMEIKNKTNKGRTIKKRIKTDNKQSELSYEESMFISKVDFLSNKSLELVLKNDFTRITLVSKKMNERCTIDYNLNFTANNNFVTTNTLVVVEIKTEGYPASSALAKALKANGIRQDGFSKYCLGRLITDNSLKHNMFKRKMLKFEKLIK